MRNWKIINEFKLICSLMAITAHSRHNLVSKPQIYWRFIVVFDCDYLLKSVPPVCHEGFLKPRKSSKSLILLVVYATPRFNIPFWLSYTNLFCCTEAWYSPNEKPPCGGVFWSKLRGFSKHVHPRFSGKKYRPRKLVSRNLFRHIGQTIISLLIVFVISVTAINDISLAMVVAFYNRARY